MKSLQKNEINNLIMSGHPSPIYYNVVRQVIFSAGVIIYRMKEEVAFLLLLCQMIQQVALFVGLFLIHTFLPCRQI